MTDKPTAAKGKFPYPHRTCAEWHYVGDQLVETKAAKAFHPKQLGR